MKSEGIFGRTSLTLNITSMRNWLLPNFPQKHQPRIQSQSHWPIPKHLRDVPRRITKCASRPRTSAAQRSDTFKRRSVNDARTTAVSLYRLINGRDTGNDRPVIIVTTTAETVPRKSTLVRRVMIHAAISEILSGWRSGVSFRRSFRPSVHPSICPFVRFLRPVDLSSSGPDSRDSP